MSLILKDFFFLDQSFPFLIKFVNQGFNKSAVRVSDYESIETAKKLAHKIDWVWIDYFNEFTLNTSEFIELKEMGFKLCLVSPELQGYDPEIEIYKLIKIFDNLKIKFDAICTKRFDLWQKFF